VIQNLLTIDANGGLVSISWRGDANNEQWQEVRYFWGSFALESDSGDLILVPMGEFITKRTWFQSYWIDLGRELTVGASLASAIDEAEKQIAHFDFLSRSDYVDSSSIEEQLGRIKLIRPLTEAQKVNVASMLRSPNGANFSVPGAGKTATQLALFSVLKELGEVKRMLVVCPKSSFEAWLEEPDEMFGSNQFSAVYDKGLVHGQTEILVVNFEKLENIKRRKELVAWTAQPGGTVLVIDEAHRVKSGARGIRWRACVELAAYAKRVDLLSGTPMPQSYEDLRNLFSLSWRSISRHRLDDDRLANLKAGGLFVRTTKGQLGLPAINIHRVVMEKGEYQKQIYGALTKRYFGLLGVSSQDQITLARKGRAVMSMIAASTNPALIAEKSRDELLNSLGWPPKELEESDLMHAIRDYLNYEIPPKFEWVTRYIDQAASQNKKTLVWSSFVGNIELLRRYLKVFNPAVIHGAISSEDRKSELERFRLDPSCAVLITNPQTLGEGVSLHKTAHEAIFVDRTYNAAQYLQALDRIHRLGLKHDQETNVYLLETEQTIDVRIGERLAKKITTLSEMLNDDGLVRVSLPGSDESQDLEELLGLDQSDLDDLLKHLGE
jgi:SNF2 family DNA or RNA helicase